MVRRRSGLGSWAPRALISLEPGPLGGSERGKLSLKIQMGGKLKKMSPLFSIKILRARLEDLTAPGRAHNGTLCLS